MFIFYMGGDCVPRHRSNKRVLASNLHACREPYFDVLPSHFMLQKLAELPTAKKEDKI